MDRRGSLVSTPRMQPAGPTISAMAEARNPGPTPTSRTRSPDRRLRPCRTCRRWATTSGLCRWQPDDRQPLCRTREPHPSPCPPWSRDGMALRLNGSFRYPSLSGIGRSAAACPRPPFAAARNAGRRGAPPLPPGSPEIGPIRECLLRSDKKSKRPRRPPAWPTRAPARCPSA